MQSKSLFFLFIAVIAVPVIALASNHEVFFSISSLVITIVSVRYIFKQITNKSLKGNEADEELQEDLEELADIDIKRFGNGLSVVSNLMVILFLFYCAFFLQTIWLKAIASFSILLQLYLIIKKTGKKTPAFNPDQHKVQILISSALNITVILFTIINKLAKIK